MENIFLTLPSSHQHGQFHINPSHSFRVSHFSWRTSCAFDNEVGDLIHKQFFFVCASIVVNALQKQWHGVEKVKRMDMHVLYIMYCQMPLLCIRHNTKRGLISKPITTLHEFWKRLRDDDAKITSLLFFLRLVENIWPGLIAGIWISSESGGFHNVVSATQINALIGSWYQTATN